MVVSESDVPLHSNAKSQRMNRGASKSDLLSVSVSVPLTVACLISLLAQSMHAQTLLLKTETFDADPGWDARNNRATDPSPRQIVQNFGYSASSSNAGGAAAAYAARAGLECFVFMPEDTPVVNQYECHIAGAKTFLVNGLINDYGHTDPRAGDDVPSTKGVL